METVGSFEAKTHWSSLLEKVALGQEVVITKRGKPIARLIPELSGEGADIAQTVEKLKTLRKSLTLGDLDWKNLRDEGRR